MGLFTLPGIPLHLQAARPASASSGTFLSPAAPRTNPHLSGSPLWGEASQQGKVSPRSPPAMPLTSLTHIPGRGAPRLSPTREGGMPFLLIAFRKSQDARVIYGASLFTPPSGHSGGRTYSTQPQIAAGQHRALLEAHLEERMTQAQPLRGGSALPAAPTGAQNHWFGKPLISGVSPSCCAPPPPQGPTHPLGLLREGVWQPCTCPCISRALLHLHRWRLLLRTPFQPCPPAGRGPCHCPNYTHCSPGPSSLGQPRALARAVPRLP